MATWTRPVFAHITQVWGQIPDAAWGARNPNGVGGHPGTDYGSLLGATIRAASDGEVVYADYATGFGPNTVCIYHPADNVTTTYGHMEYHNVVQGQQVKAGDAIGLCGSMGQSTGPHLHFEVRPGRQNFGGNPPNVDSEAFLAARLVPAQPKPEDIMANLPTIDSNNALDMQHPMVRTAEALLAARGGWITGAQNTDHAVFANVLKWFQAATALPVDGILGPLTWQKLVQPLNGK